MTMNLAPKRYTLAPEQLRHSVDDGSSVYQTVKEEEEDDGERGDEELLCLEK